MESVYSNKSLSLSTISSDITQTNSRIKKNTTFNRIKQGIKTFFCNTKNIYTRVVIKLKNKLNNFTRFINHQYNKLLLLIEKVIAYYKRSPMLQTLVLRTIVISILIFFCITFSI